MEWSGGGSLSQFLGSALVKLNNCSFSYKFLFGRIICIPLIPRGGDQTLRNGI